MNKKYMFSSSLALFWVTLILAFAVIADGSETSQVTSSAGDGSVGQEGRPRSVKSPRRRLTGKSSSGSSKSSKGMEEGMCSAKSDSCAKLGGFCKVNCEDSSTSNVCVTGLCSYDKGASKSHKAQSSKSSKSAKADNKCQCFVHF